MNFLGRKLHGKFQGELVSGLHEYELKGRLPGRRVKHRMKGNWIKMYDKFGSVLRIETVINQPAEFRVRRRVRRKDKRVTEWVPIRKDRPRKSSTRRSLFSPISPSGSGDTKSWPPRSAASVGSELRFKAP
jgi:hypothetical protein